VFQSEAKLEDALKQPDIEIGPPPWRSAPAGRMNAQGISVFYGATDSKTALAEVRPPFGSRVVFAQFEIIRSIKLLDVRVLQQIFIAGSIFDPGYLPKLKRAAFLKRLSETISRPVMPDDDSRRSFPSFNTRRSSPHPGSDRGGQWCYDNSDF
jgi:hypothetical protein